LTVDVLGLKVDVLVVDPIKIDVLELVQLGGPGRCCFCRYITF
jgi:hypothetical protein